MIKIIFGAFFFVIAAAVFVISWFQFHERGFLLNNAYLFASREERERMDKTPYYRQSGTVFTLIGVCLLLLAAGVILESDWLFYAMYAVAFAAVVYAIVSAVRIEKNRGAS